MNDSPTLPNLIASPNPPARVAAPPTRSERLKRGLASLLRGFAWFLAMTAVLALSILIVVAFFPDLGAGRVVLGNEFDVPLSEVTQHGILATLGVWLVLTLVLVIAGLAILFALVVTVVAVVLSLFVTALALIVPGLLLLAPVALIAWAAYAVGRRSARAEAAA